MPSFTQSTVKPSWRRPFWTAAPIMGSSSTRRMRMATTVRHSRARRESRTRLQGAWVPAWRGDDVLLYLPNLHRHEYPRILALHQERERFPRLRRGLEL